MEDSDQYHKRREGERLNWIVECPGTFSMCFGVIPFVGESVEYGECGHKKKGKRDNPYGRILPSNMVIINSL